MSDEALASPTTTGLELTRAPRRLRDIVELVSSMRFAIALLTVICIASGIGTVVTQHEPFNNYVNQFGPFWAEVFGAAGLFAVYSTGWFLLILAALVVSTSLCIARNAPKIVADLRTMKEGLREQSLAAFHHHARATLDETPDAAFTRVSALLAREGWRGKAQTRVNGTMVAARRGAASRLGYIAAHSAIVLICLGGLFDGDLIVRAQMALQGKQFVKGLSLNDATEANRLSAATPTFRGNLFVPEGQRHHTAVINMAEGAVLQALPFDVELKRFIVEYYATGMPKLFASEIVLHDLDTGRATPATVKVNEPVIHRGIAIYQSSFDDGGSSLSLRGLPMGANNGRSIELQGVVGNSAALADLDGSGPMRIEFTGLRVINVENLAGGPKPGDATDVRRVDLGQALDKHLGSGAKPVGQKQLRNVGPSVSYKLRDAAGQAREFNNYMLPIELDGARLFLAGVRENPNENFRYLRLPADENGRLDGWVRLRRAVNDATLRERAVERYIARAVPTDKPEMLQQLRVTAARVLGLFAGSDSPRGNTSPDATKARGGLPALSEFLETTVPDKDRGRISEVLLRVLDGTLFELMNLARENDKLAPLGNNEQTQTFMAAALIALSDARYYPAPVMFELTDFKQVQASVFQVTRAPGKLLVYGGAVLLIVGVFAMLYTRERRLWVWLSPADGGTRVECALSTPRRTLDADAEFDRLKAALLSTGAAA